MRRESHFWVARCETGYFHVAPDRLASYNVEFKNASRFDSSRELKNAILGAATLSALNNTTSPDMVRGVRLERMAEVCEVDQVMEDLFVTDEKVARLKLVREQIAGSAAKSYQWIMTSPKFDYRDWKFCAALPEWEFSEPDDRTVERRLNDIGLPAVISGQYVFLKREEDFAAFRLAFDDILLFFELETANILVDNRQ